MKKVILIKLIVNVIAILFFLFLLFNAFVFVSKNQTKKIIGSWELNMDKNQVNYPCLSFYPDSSAAFTSHADTIYRFKYWIKSGSLILKDNYSGVVTENKILRLTSRELIFDNLLSNNLPQYYLKPLNIVNNK
jgi:hypothetical protein